MTMNRIFAVLCAFVVAFSLCVPAFASSSTSEFIALPICSDDPSTLTGIGISPFTRDNYLYASPFDDIYIAAYVDGNYQNIVIMTKTDQRYYYRQSSGGVPNYSPLGNSDPNYSQYGVYWSQNILRQTVTSDIPVYQSLDSLLSAFSTFVPGSSDTGQPISVVLPAGNVIFVELPSGQANQIEASTSSALDHSSPWNGSNQAWGYSSSLPSSNFSVPYPGTSPFSWKHAGKTNIFGTTRNWSFFSLLDSSNKYLVVVNPAYPEDQPTNQAINGSITISLPHALSYRVYSLSTEWSSGNLVGSWDSESDPTFSGDYDPDTGSWGSVNDQTGSPGSPSAGGNNIVSESGQNIHDWLQSIANSISGFFNGAIGAVTTLTSAASEFVGSFIHLYSWLPTSVLSVLTSAIILAITIGVIKVFI